MAARAWIVALALAWALALASAHPNYVGCDRTGDRSGEDIMTKSSIMGSAPTDTTLMTASSTTYGPGDSVTVTLSGLSSGAFVHATAGTPSTISGFTAKTCTGTSLQYKSSSVSSTETLTWTAPADLTNVATVEISVGTAAGQGVLKRHKLTLTRAAAAACAANESVSAGACVACAAGTTRTAGDDPYGGDTTCAATASDDDDDDDNTVAADADDDDDDDDNTVAADADDDDDDDDDNAVAADADDDDDDDDDDAVATDADDDDDDVDSASDTSPARASSASSRVVPTAALAGSVLFYLYP
jgi:hypothetical protein